MSRQQLLTRLKTKGYKLTQQRQQILEILLTTTSRLSALEVHRLLQKRQVKISLDTVYRNLRLLVEWCPAADITTVGAVYELVQQDQLHSHVICVDCEKVVCIPAGPACNSMELAGAAGFTILVAIWIYGRCSAVVTTIPTVKVGCCYRLLFCCDNSLIIV